jgi:hypothetical protein
MQWLLASQIKILPAASTFTSLGLFSVAEIAGPPSPLYEPSALPAMVDIMPDVLIIRIRLLSASAIYMFPEASTAEPFGWFNVADVAAPPSPLYPAVELPAIVLMVCALKLLWATPKKKLPNKMHNFIFIS